MGSGRWDDKAWSSYAAKTIKNAKSVDDIYTSRSLDKLLDPKGIKIRESCDSADNPNSTPIIVALDVTGSMGYVLDTMARDGLKTLAEEIYDRKPVADPHIMFMGVGDVEYDAAPLQITEFEADIRIAEQLSKIYLERGGGGNEYESYIFPWYFAAMHTKIDSFDKRGKKGYLFTIGDEEITPSLTASAIERFLGYKPEFDSISAKELYTIVSRYYNVYHLMVEEGAHYSCRPDQVVRSWTAVMGENAIKLQDHRKMAEVIVSILQINSGEEVEDVVQSWDGSTSLVVQRAIGGLSVAGKQEEGIVRF